MRYLISTFLICLLPTTCLAAGLADIEKAVMMQDYPAAESLAMEFLDEDPVGAQARAAEYLLAVSKLRLQKYSAATQDFRKLVQSDVEKDLRDKAYLGLFDCYYQQGKYKRALKTIDKLQDISSRSNYLSLIYLKAARVNLKLSKWKEAKDYLQRIIERYPDSFEYHAARQLLEEEQYFAVQVGAFMERERALQVVDALQYQDHYAYIVETMDRDQRKFYRVRVGQVTVLREAERLRKELSKLGYPTRIYP
ncbi:MAG: SPOR domain-containing protein [Candidatus Omnitrophica bacterium]|nr:SPOR domain-containing protein [Candidatus Omnitrophota bacterium]